MRGANLFIGLAASLLAIAPLRADTVLTLHNHSDEVTMMGHTTPAQDVTHEYWFGDQGTRYDAGATTVIMRVDQKKIYFVNNEQKTYSALDLPVNFKDLVSPQMAPMMEQMSKMMQATTKVTPTDRKGSFAGFDCKYSHVDISMGMMQMGMDECLSQKLPIDYARYKSLAESQAEMLPSTQWMKDLAEQLKGFPVHTDVTTSMMGKSFKSWNELQKVEKKAAPAGFYDPPAGYKEVKYDPMQQMQHGRQQH